MFSPELFQPVLAQVALTFVLGLATGGARFAARASGATKGRELTLGQLNWPTRVQQISNALNNQFETPILFYVGIAFAMIAGVTDPLLVTLAWVFVGSRVAHALIYVSVNIVPIRFLAFAVGLIAIGVFWVVLAQAVL